MGRATRRTASLAQSLDRAGLSPGPTARLLTEGCFSGQVVVVPASVQLSDLPYDVVS
jgi:hypothetical protein